jgi:hypothetical protein
MFLKKFSATDVNNNLRLLIKTHKIQWQQKKEKQLSESQQLRSERQQRDEHSLRVRKNVLGNRSVFSYISKYVKMAILWEF